MYCNKYRVKTHREKKTLEEDCKSESVENLTTNELQDAKSMVNNGEKNRLIPKTPLTWD